MHTMDFTRDIPREGSGAASTAPGAAKAEKSADKGEKSAIPGLSAPIASWLQRVEAAAHPQPKLELEIQDPKVAQYKFVYVLAPTSGGRHVALCLCKARLRPNGEVAAASPVSEVFSLLSAPPAYLQGDDEDLVRFFIAMRSGGTSQGGGATEPKGKVGAILLQMLLEQEKLLWANSWQDMANGLIYPLKAGPVREANLVWRDEGRTAKLGWAVQPAGNATHVGADQIDYMLPTDPPWYIDNLSCGALSLNRGGVDISLADLQALVAQAPLLTGTDKKRVSQLLLAHGLQQLMPLPQPLTQRLRDDVKPQAHLLLDSISLPDGSHSRWHDYAVLSFDYDGERVSFDPAQRVVRQIGDVTEVIARDAQAEADALAALTQLGFRKPATAPLNALSGALQLESQAHWLRFAEGDLDELSDQGWHIKKSAKYRYDVVPVQDWYADIDEPAEAGNAWFELELGIVVNQKRVPLLPVLVQLIRSAPSDFDPEVLAAHADIDQMLATLPDGVRVALPWGRLKPILGTLGELYFNDKIKNRVRLSTLDASRLDELARGTELNWTGGEQLRETGRKLAQFGSVQKVPAPAGLQAALRDYQADGLAWMQFLREYDLAGILADDMGLGKTVQTIAHILTEKEAGRLTRPALVIAPTSLMANWQEEAKRFAPDLRVLLLQGKERLDLFDKIDEADLVLTTYALLPRDEEKLREHEYHLVILDESHYIKNTRSKAAQSAGLLKSRHRLCLSGTPLENH
ncbi:MAG: DEAD/DEAH box helicase, partial [Gammaproteobacteria bacterium]